jgi:hypothetical protein
VSYNNAQNIIKIELSVNQSYTNKEYHWKWNDSGTLLDSPENWDKPLPWKRFESIEKEIGVSR